MTRAQWDGILEAAKCTILGTMSNDKCDSYILSESSLFVYTHKMVLKTCGTTTLLRCLDPLMRATEVGCVQPVPLRSRVRRGQITHCSQVPSLWGSASPSLLSLLALLATRFCLPSPILLLRPWACRLSGWPTLARTSYSLACKSSLTALRMRRQLTCRSVSLQATPLLWAL